MTRNLDAIIAEYKSMLGLDQVKPGYVEEFDECVKLLAQEKRKGVSELFECLEKDIANKLEFI